MQVLDIGTKTDISIGFSDKDFILSKQVGMTSKSYSLTSEGRLCHEKEVKDKFVAKFKLNDKIGCGYYFNKKTIFYTYNGKYIGEAFKMDKYFNMYPTISLHSSNEKVKVNFGKEPFVFDVNSYIKDVINNENKEKSIIEVDLTDVSYIIKEYLVHSGYRKTLKSIENEETRFKNEIEKIKSKEKGFAEYDNTNDADDELNEFESIKLFKGRSNIRNVNYENSQVDGNNEDYKNNFSLEDEENERNRFLLNCVEERNSKTYNIYFI